MAPTSLRLNLVEYVDRVALAGITVQTRATVIVNRKVDVVDGFLDGPGHGPGTPARPSAGGGNTLNVVARTTENFVYEMANHIAETKTLVTDASGLAAFEWDPTVDPLFKAAFDDFALRFPGVPPLVHFNVGVGLGTTPGPMMRLTEPLAEGHDRHQDLFVHLASTIVGHVTDTSARLWFRLSRDATQQMSTSFMLTRRGQPIRGRRPTPVTFSSGPHPTAVVDLAGLDPATDYEYAMIFSRGRTAGPWPAGRGSFRTADPASTRLRLAFASCSDPRTSADLERWRALDRWNPELVLFIGDQIYGDLRGAERAKASATEVATTGTLPPLRPPAGGWASHYDRRYHRVWGLPTVRDVLRRRPIYMMIDDHDVADDWGTTFTRLTSGGPGARVQAALTAYQAYQHSHNPPTPGRRANATFDYAFARGPVAFFAFDERTGRALETANPILGADQVARFDAWTTSAEVAAADVLVIVSPVPFAFCDVALATAIFKAIDLVNDVVGLGNPLWGLSDDVFGWSPDDLVDYVLPDVKTSDGRIVEPDLADQWSNSQFQPELAHVLGRLFDLQNDPSHRRAVVVLSGDSHIGAFHSIRSGRRRHSNNNVIYQVTASPIATTPESGLADKLNTSDDLMGGFVLAPTFELPLSFYTGKIECLVGRRNFGSLVVERRPTGRVYEIRASLHPERSPVWSDTEVRLDLVVDLDTGGRPTPMWNRPSPMFSRS